LAQCSLLLVEESSFMWVRVSDSKTIFKLQNLVVALFTCAVMLAKGTGI